ncbi:MAG: DUF4432 family protein, partial [Chloroflexota bacterium]
VLPGHGAKVTELVSKRAGRDLLFHHPRLDVRAPVFGVNADDWWTGGIDEIAPTGHPCVVGGEQLPFLGEFWSQAWAATIVERGPERVVVDLVAHGVITPLRLERRMELAAGEPVLRSRHVVRNVGHEPVDFMWGLHPGLAIRPGSRIQVPAASGVFAEGHPTLHVEPGTRFAWPMLPVRDGDAIDLSTARPPTPPSWELVYLDALSAGWLAVTDPPTRSGFAITFDPKVLPVVWLWGVYGGWRGIYAAAVEAWTSYPARLDQAIEAGRQVTLAPGETWEATVGLVAFEGVTSVSGVHADGRVEGDG